MNKRVAFKTLGCRLNQYETDALVSKFHKREYQIVDYGEFADIYVINTCTVTKQSDTKSRHSIRQAAKNNSEAVIIVTGCMVNNHREQLQQQLEEVTYFIDNKDKSSIFDIVDAHYKGETYNNPYSPNLSLFNYDAAKETLHTRSMIKIQDGCNNFCSYCIIPSVRGKATSRNFDDVLNNVKLVLSFGYKEIILTGVNIGKYRWENYHFDDLVEAILNIEGEFRLRISSIEPFGFTPKLINLFAHPKLTPHLHLCLQSGSNSVLSIMRRNYLVDDFTGIMQSLREIRSDFNFTTDIIVGFPGETDDDFAESIKAVKTLGFSHIHTFKYSMREGTPATKISPQVPDKVKTTRSEIIRNLAQDNKLNYRKSFIGKKQTILIEKNDSKGCSYGYSEYFIPVKIYGIVQKNSFITVTITDIETKGGEIYLVSKELDNSAINSAKNSSTLT